MQSCPYKFTNTAQNQKPGSLPTRKSSWLNRMLRADSAEQKQDSSKVAKYRLQSHRSLGDIALNFMASKLTGYGPLEANGFTGPKAAQIAAHGTRDGKEILSTQQVMTAHYKVAELHGNQLHLLVRTKVRWKGGATYDRCPYEQSVEIVVFRLTFI